MTPMRCDGLVRCLATRNRDQLVFQQSGGDIPAAQRSWRGVVAEEQRRFVWLDSISVGVFVPHTTNLHHVMSDPHLQGLS